MFNILHVAFRYSKRFLDSNCRSKPLNTFHRPPSRFAPPYCGRSLLPAPPWTQAWTQSTHYNYWQQLNNSMPELVSTNTDFSSLFRYLPHPYIPLSFISNSLCTVSRVQETPVLQQRGFCSVNAWRFWLTLSHFTYFSRLNFFQTVGFKYKIVS